MKLIFYQDDKRSLCNTESKDDQRLDSIDSEDSEDHVNDDKGYAKSNIVKGKYDKL